MRTNIDTRPYVELRREEVARRTLRLWQAAKRPTGRDLEFWLQAEVELVAERQYRGSDRILALDQHGPDEKNQFMKLVNGPVKNSGRKLLGTSNSAQKPDW